MLYKAEPVSSLAPCEMSYTIPVVVVTGTYPMTSVCFTERSHSCYSLNATTPSRPPLLRLLFHIPSAVVLRSMPLTNRKAYRITRTRKRKCARYCPGKQDRGREAEKREAEANDARRDLSSVKRTDVIGYLPVTTTTGMV